MTKPDAIERIIQNRIIRQRRNQALNYREYLHKIINLARLARKPESSQQYSPKLDIRVSFFAAYYNVPQEKFLAYRNRKNHSTWR